ncbi:MAG: hypothetical protein AAGC68_01420 [Verrucomicrobiota bacterium]
MSFSIGLLARPSATLAVCALVWSGLCPAQAISQEALDPSDIWYRGYILVREAEDLEKRKDYNGALNKLTEAQPYFIHLAQAFPDYQAEIVRERRHLIEEGRERLKRLQRAPRAVPALPQATTPQPVASAPTYPAIPPPPTQGAGTPIAYDSATIELSPEELDGNVPLPTWEEGSSQVLPRVSGGVDNIPRVETRRPSVGAIAGSIRQEYENKDSLIGWLNEKNQDLQKKLADRERLLERLSMILSESERTTRLSSGRKGALRLPEITKNSGRRASYWTLPSPAFRSNST